MGDVLKALGPGLLFAAAAVGVSHLVQSTRAGAAYGLAMVGFVVVANVTKYPAFRFAPEYVAATGTSLLEGYRRQGRWALWLYLAVTLLTMFTVQAAVTVVTAALAIALFGQASPVLVSAALIAVCLLLLRLGQFKWLDRVTKLLVATFTLCTLMAAGLAMGRIDWSGDWFPNFTGPEGSLNLPTLAFTVALVGWMPAPIDLAVWQSLWTLARRKDTGHAATLGQARIDFHIGYLGSAGLALCFLFMGAGIMFGSGREFPNSAGKFASEVVNLYSETLGSGAGLIVAVCAFAVMFSTTLTVVDGFPRALSALLARFFSAETPHEVDPTDASKRNYWIVAVVLALGSILVLQLFLTSLKAFVDVATTLSFLTAPVLALLNHRSIHGEEVPAEFRPSASLRTFSWICIAFHTGFALFYLYVSYGL
jgi:Mn2+/Fe2+ NRAMP family transporter